ncbi:flavodoxin family protein [Thermoclostridium caenicola]|uniref:NADPH-dependent FMN reductase n=1 Tax=Thermoclostridium caenicola TaxID=659425 RepID=A0A1M6JRY5_9FIRM|nr:NAD(P)H-dependent oxidoreductase [Thermoclostridium caenicola]SHJ49464.1 NADPH-dependent FMN reductase [Thermoclostridium caenicola]HOP72673.1 NAD(P)H-dependent oxidoreductase [Thermoclostridium caenicola]
MKRITIVNGIQEDVTGFEKSLDRMMERLRNRMVFECFRLREMNISYCCGCLGCWVKSPGKCLYKDDMVSILKSVIRSDLVILISPVVMGFVSPLIKKATDRFIPLIHPYITIVRGECHHKKRYGRYPYLGLVLVDKESDSMNDSELITAVYKRAALNLRSRLLFTVCSNGSTEGLEHEIDDF